MIYYIGYVLKKEEYDINRINHLYLIVRYLLGRKEKIDGTSDRHLVIDDGYKKVLGVYEKLWKFTEGEINDLMRNSDKITSGLTDNSIKRYKKLRFSSYVDLPLNTLIEFYTLTIVINCVIEKGGKHYREIYLDECFCMKLILYK